MAASSNSTRRYNLVLPESIFQEVEQIANQHNTTVVDVLRKFIKLGLVVAKLEDAPNASLIIREEGKEKEILLL
jgi:hypothetical protein